MRGFILIIKILLLSLSLQASDDKLPLQRHFKNISVEHGLSQSTVYCITQDTLGFMWFGTQDGLNRYDGRKFDVFNPIEGDSTSISSNYIRSVLIDKNGRLWFGGNNGISLFDYTSESFTNFLNPSQIGSWVINSIVEGPNDVIWAASSNGELFQFNESKREFVRLNFRLSIYNIKELRTLSFIDSTLYIGTERGLFKIPGKRTEPVKIDIGMGDVMINTIYYDKNTLWIGTEGDGLVQYNMTSGKAQQFIHQPFQESLIDNDVRSIAEDEDGDLWIGTMKGLSILDAKTRRFENYVHSYSLPYSLSQNSVRCLFIDKQQGMWLGTFYGGVNYYYRNNIQFNLLNQNSGKESLNDQVVNTIYESKGGGFWIGTNDRGLNFWDRNRKIMRYYMHDERLPGSISSNNIKAIIEDEAGNLLLGTHNSGLNHFNPATGENRIYKHDGNNPTSIVNDMVYSLLRDRNNRIWVGTRSGLDLFNYKTGVFSHVYVDNAGNKLSHHVINCLYEDSKGRIWVGTTNGITIINPESMLFETLSNTEKQRILSDNFVTIITEDSFGRIWVGTRNGLNMFNEETRVFEKFTQNDGLLNNVIAGVISDQDGSLWISTNKGLVHLMPGKWARTYDFKDGLQSNQFNAKAFAKARDGMMLFGGIKGISYFYPQSVGFEPLNLKVTFTGLEVHNKKVIPGDSYEVLNTHIDQVKQLKLKADLKQFSILFSAFNFIHPDKIHYEYKLDGFDDTWQKAGTVGRVTYTNLKAGNYTFQVRAKGPLNDHSEIRTLSIQVLPHWWATVWFKLAVALLIGAMLHFLFRFIRERIRTRHQLRVARMEKEKDAQVNQAKMEFFTNISHEFRTPLTLIKAPIEEILSKAIPNSWLKKRYELIYHNTERLLNLVNQLMEFRQADLGTLNLSASPGDFVRVVHNVYKSFTHLAEKKDINYLFESTEKQLPAVFDEDFIQKITFNLISNAFKFTPGGKAISVQVSAESGYLLIKVKDSGIGIAERDQHDVFTRFFQVKQDGNRMGSGVGLALTKKLVELHQGEISLNSSLGQGSEFLVRIPFVEEGYSINNEPEEMVEDYKLEPVDFLLSEQVDEGEVSPEGERETILLVDDNVEILFYLKESFKQNHHVITAQNGLQVMEIVEKEVVDLIICDVMMPEMDGIHVCKRIKKNIRTSHIPIILLTARNGFSQQLEGFEVGADDYITKPFSINVLRAKVNNIIRTRRQLKQHYSASKDIEPKEIAFNTLDEEFLNAAIDIIEKNLSEPDFSVAILSRELGMSRSNLYLKVKAITGESVTDFIKRIKFKKAVELLKTRRYTISQIAYMTGFNSPSYFSTSFKQYFSCLPSEYLTEDSAT